jgi:O-antigen ligase
MLERSSGPAIMRTFALWLSFILVFTIPWEDAFNIAEMGTISRITGILTAMVWFTSVVITRRFRDPYLFVVFTCIFCFWNMMSFFWSRGVDETVQQIKTYIQLGVMSWILWDLYTTSKALRSALQSFILGLYVALGSTIFNYFTEKEISAYEAGRYAGAGVNAVELALILAVGLPVAWHLAVSPTKGIMGRILRILNFLYIPAAIFGITLTGSRTALFAVLPGFLYIVAKKNMIKPFLRILIFAFFLIALFVLIPSVPDPTLERLSTTSASIATGDLGGRGNLWAGAIEKFSEHPILGVGSGALRSSGVLNGVAHNTFLSVLSELGLVGFVLFAVILVIVVLQLRRQPKLFSALWVSVLVTWAIGSFSLTLEYHKLTWLILTSVVVSSNFFEPRDRVTESSLLSRTSSPNKPKWSMTKSTT